MAAEPTTRTDVAGPRTGTRTGRRGRARRALRIVGATVLVLTLIGAAYAAVVARRSLAPLALPTPPGSYAVGRVETTLTDPGRQGRRVSVWAWYPAVTGSGRPAAYAPGAWRGLQLGPPIGESRLDRIHDPAREAASPAPGRFPLVVLLPGLGFAAPQYAVLAESLASRGYVVVGVTPTGSANLTVLDGRPRAATAAGDPSDFDGDHTPHDEAVATRLLGVWVADAGLAARSVGLLSSAAALGSHVRAGGVAYVGHSFGGTAALQACHDDPDCAAAVDLDGGIFGPVATSGLPVPTLLEGHDGSCITGACTPSTSADVADRTVGMRFRTASGGSVRVATIADTGHLAFSDYGVYYIALPLRRLLGLGGRDGVAALAQMSALVAATLRSGFGR